MEADPIPSQDEDFNDEVFDENFYLMIELILKSMSYQEWLDVMTPLWIKQLSKDKK